MPCGAHDHPRDRTTQLGFRLMCRWKQSPRALQECLIGSSAFACLAVCLGLRVVVVPREEPALVAKFGDDSPCVHESAFGCVHQATFHRTRPGENGNPVTAWAGRAIAGCLGNGRRITTEKAHGSFTCLATATCSAFSREGRALRSSSSPSQRPFFSLGKAAFRASDHRRRPGPSSSSRTVSGCLADRSDRLRRRFRATWLGFGGMRFVGSEDGGLVFADCANCPEAAPSPARSHTMRLDPQWVTSIAVEGSRVWPGDLPLR